MKWEKQKDINCPGKGVLIFGSYFRQLSPNLETFTVAFQKHDFQNCSRAVPMLPDLLPLRSRRLGSACLLLKLPPSSFVVVAPLRTACTTRVHVGMAFKPLRKMMSITLQHKQNCNFYFFITFINNFNSIPIGHTLCTHSEYGCGRTRTSEDDGYERKPGNETSGQEKRTNKQRRFDDDESTQKQATNAL